MLQGQVWGFKVNDLLYEDLEVIQKLKKFGNVFADVKLHDIPNTVANSVKRLSDRGVDIITVHASGGIDMMSAAKQSAGNGTKVVAVTVLTSDKFKDDTKSKVVNLVRDSICAKVDGVVCSGHELEAIKEVDGSESLLKIVPGIRPADYVKDDQERVMTPTRALELGADLLVIGRPITESEDPLRALLDMI